MIVQLLMLLFQFIVIASGVSFTKPDYSGLETTTSGEVIGWMLTSTPLIIIVAFGVYEILKRRPINRKNILKIVRLVFGIVICFRSYKLPEKTKFLMLLWQTQVSVLIA